MLTNFWRQICVVMNLYERRLQCLCEFLYNERGGRGAMDIGHWWKWIQIWFSLCFFPIFLFSWGLISVFWHAKSWCRNSQSMWNGKRTTKQLFGKQWMEKVNEIVNINSTNSNWKCNKIANEWRMNNEKWNRFDIRNESAVGLTAIFFSRQWIVF